MGIKSQKPVDMWNTWNRRKGLKKEPNILSGFESTSDHMWIWWTRYLLKIVSRSLVSPTNYDLIKFYVLINPIL
jgi:hypothetical protein